MGISDRHYIRVGPRASSGLGNLRFISFNTWLIIINVAVFLLNNVFLGNVQSLQVSASMGNEYAPQVTREQRDRGVVVNEIRPHPAVPGWYVKPIIDPKTITTAPNGQPVPVIIGSERFAPMPVIEALGHFSTAKAFVPGFQVWRFITFQFLHYDIMHLAFNMIGLWFVGGMVEQHLGRKRYAAFYLVCGIFGALMYLFLNFLGYSLDSAFGKGAVHIPGVLFNDVYTPLIGASAGVFGVLIAAARLEPNATVWVYFLFPVRLRIAVLVLAAITLFNLFAGSHNAGGEAAHVGGIIAGYYFIRRPYLLRDFFDVLGNSRRPPRRPGAATARRRPPPSLGLEGEIERILRKVESEGIQSLSEHEKRLLRQFNESRG